MHFPAIVIGDDPGKQLTKFSEYHYGDKGLMYNPEARYDYCSFGGGWHGSLILISGMSGIRAYPHEDVQYPDQRVDAAKNGEIDWTATLREFVPRVVLFNGELIEAPVVDNERWLDYIRRILELTGSDTMIWIYDLHI